MGLSFGQLERKQLLTGINVQRELTTKLPPPGALYPPYRQTINLETEVFVKCFFFSQARQLRSHLFVCVVFGDYVKSNSR